MFKNIMFALFALACALTLSLGTSTADSLDDATARNMSPLDDQGVATDWADEEPVSYSWQECIDSCYTAWEECVAECGTEGQVCLQYCRAERTACKDSCGPF